jgi:hypothetical protein
VLISATAAANCSGDAILLFRMSSSKSAGVFGATGMAAHLGENGADQISEDSSNGNLGQKNQS